MKRFSGYHFYFLRNIDSLYPGICTTLDAETKASKKIQTFDFQGELASFIFTIWVFIYYKIYSNKVRVAAFEKKSSFEYRKKLKLMPMNTFSV